MNKYLEISFPLGAQVRILPTARIFFPPGFSGMYDFDFRFSRKLSSQLYLYQIGPIIYALLHYLLLKVQFREIYNTCLQHADMNSTLQGSSNSDLAVVLVNFSTLLLVRDKSL